MTIVCLGLSHLTAPVELRERLNYPRAALQAALARFGCGRDEMRHELAELVILSTCNRLELYGALPTTLTLDHPFEPLLAFLDATRGVPRAEYAAHLYQLVGREAVTHVCRVAAGLDSMILGEPQILGQVSDAFHTAAAHGAAGPILTAVFHAAIRAGKRSRTETAISRNPATLSSVAVRLATRAAGGFSLKCVLVVGAGEMAELAVEALRTRGASQIIVVNRTHARAEQLAQRWGARALTYERLDDALAEADIVFTSTDAPHTVISAELAEAVLARRPERRLVFIDIAVPRDVDPQVRSLPSADYYDIDDLAAHLNGTLAERQQEIPRVETIVAEETDAFVAWTRGLEVTPLIAGLHAKADAIRRAEVDKALRRLPQLGELERRQIERLTEALVNKLLHEPTRRLKAESQRGNPAAFAAAVRELFALND